MALEMSHTTRKKRKLNPGEHPSQTGHIPARKSISGEDRFLTDSRSLSHPQCFPCSTSETCQTGTDEQCPAFLPCNNPTCEDGLPCSAEQDCSDPTTCLGNVCFDEHCLSDNGDMDVCFDDLCTEGSRCASPCYRQGCEVPACEAQCPEANFTQCPTDANSWYQHHAYDHTLHNHGDVSCIDPRCLHNTHHTHFHSSLEDATDHDRHSHYDYCQTPGAYANTWQNQSEGLKDLASLAHKPAKQRICSGSIYQTRDSTTTCSVNVGPNQYTLDLAQPSYTYDSSSSPPDLISSPSATPSSCFSADPIIKSEMGVRQTYTCYWCDNDGNQPSRICGQTFTNAPDLHLHVEKAHIDSLPREEDADNGFFCRWSGCDRFMQRSFQARPKLKRHMQTHTHWKPFVCSVCGVQMKTKDAMDKHARTHTGERPYKCDEPGCSKIFATSTELKTHMVVHSGAKPHKCETCGECFADSSNLSKHRKVHYIGAFKCPVCGVRMKRWDQMRRHMVTQRHALQLIDEPELQRQYKAQMDLEFKSMPDNQKVISAASGFNSRSLRA